MLLYALLQTKSPISVTSLEFIFRGYGMAGGMMTHGDLVLVQIRDETFRDEKHVEHFISGLKGQGLTLLLLTEPNPGGVNEILFPKPYGTRAKTPYGKPVEKREDDPCVLKSDQETDEALAALCKFLKAKLGREWRHKQRIWKDQWAIPCA